jgi:hypothetical protein
MENEVSIKVTIWNAGHREKLPAIFAHGRGPQIIVEEVGIDPARYVDQQYQRRVRAPSVCPKCGKAQALEAHANTGSVFSPISL